jgi:hypothetical protein
MVFEREKDIEIEDLGNGEVKLSNCQSVKISSPKEAANFIEKCVSLNIA